MNQSLSNNFEKIYTLDTNIILHDAHNLELLSDHNKNLIVIPEIVIDEIDTKKSGFEEINYQAREFGRLLENAIVEAHVKKNVNEVDYSIIEISIPSNGGTVTIHLVTKGKYDSEKVNTKSSILNDRKILEIADFVQNYYETDIDKEYKKSDKILLSMDILARTRGLAMGLNVEALGIKEAEELSFNNFIKELDVDSHEFNTFETMKIEELNQEHEPRNFSYTLTAENGQKKFGVVQNGMFRYIDEEKLKQQYISPKNAEQLFLSNALIDSHYNMIAVDSKAGTGKTLLSVSAGMRNVRKGLFSKIVYIRNSVESVDLSSEDIGFLPGSMEEKLKVYNHALYDSVENIARTEVSKKNKGDRNEEQVKEKMEELIQKYNFETMWPGELRGRTIQESFVIIDEAQNFSKKGLATVLSRVDKSCKVVILGNWQQVDNSYLNKYSNGLTHFLNLTNDEYEEINLFAIELTRVLRGPITKWVEEVYNKQTK